MVTYVTAPTSTYLITTSSTATPWLAPVEDGRLQIINLGTAPTPTVAISTSTSATYHATGTPWIVVSGSQYANPEDYESYQEALARAAKKRDREHKARIERARSAVKKALKLMDTVGMGGEIRIFLGGQEIEVAHQDSLFKFVIKKYRNSIISRTVHPGMSTPYELSLFTKSEIHVADLCVYMPQTPVLDQVLAVAMFIRSGDEELILSKANWRNLCPDRETREILALEYPALREKLRVDALVDHEAPQDTGITFNIEPGRCHIQNATLQVNH